MPSPILVATTHASAGHDAFAETANRTDTVAPPTPPVALTVQEASHALRLDPRTIRAMLRSGELEGNQRGHAIRISQTSVIDWLRGKRRVPRSKR